MDNHKAKTEIKVIINTKGPYAVFGGVSVHDYFIVNGEDGKALRYEKGEFNYSKGDITYLCRCGKSQNKPYCDGTHLKVEWDSELTGRDEKFMDGVKVYEGSRYTLWDKESLCAIARFCDVRRGVWLMIQNPINEQEVELSLRASQLCPAGRLVVQDNATGQMLEPNMQESIGIIEDTPIDVSGPIWIRGGIPLVTEVGDVLERRNRITLCRCGASINKPYCDGAHISINFQSKA